MSEDDQPDRGPAGPAETAGHGGIALARDSDRRSQQREDSSRDRVLIERVRAGESRAFDDLYRLYHTRAYNLAFRVTKNEQAALDVVQESFIKVYRNLDSFEGGSSFYTWLYRIVMNLSIDKVRSDTRDQRLVEFDERQTGDHDLLGGNPQKRASNPLHRVMREELSGRIRAALAELPEYHQVAIVLREVEGLSYEEIAEIMDCPKGTVMSRLFHARRKMQEQLAPYLDGSLDIED